MLLNRRPTHRARKIPTVRLREHADGESVPWPVIVGLGSTVSTRNAFCWYLVLLPPVCKIAKFSQASISSLRTNTREVGDISTPRFAVFFVQFGTCGNVPLIFMSFFKT